MAPFTVVWCALAALAFACASPPESVDQSPVGGVEGDAATDGVPVPTFHHMHINSVDPDASLDWWHTFWPSGTITTVGEFPAFEGDGVYLLSRISDFAVVPYRQAQSPRLDFWGSGVRNHTMEGDTRWVNYNTSHFSSRSTAS